MIFLLRTLNLSPVLLTNQIGCSMWVDQKVLELALSYITVTVNVLKFQTLSAQKA